LRVELHVFIILFFSLFFLFLIFLRLLFSRRIAVLQDVLQALELVEAFHDDEALREALVPRPVEVVVWMVLDVLLKASDHLIEARIGVCDHDSAVLHV